MILLDTDIMIDIIRDYAPALAWLESIKSEQVGIPGFVALELYQGCRSKSEQTVVNSVLDSVEIVWPSAEACEQALDLYVRFHLSHNLGTFDALIGQTALALDLSLCTFNQKHYDAIPDLETSQPYVRG